MRWPKFETRIARRGVLVLPQALHRCFTVCGVCGLVFLFVLSMNESQGLNLVAIPGEYDLGLWGFMWITIIGLTLGAVAVVSESSES